jgi:hypothetical protein
MHLVELIPTAATRPEILDQLEGFLVTTLGKGVVRAKDTPNFIANRVGVFSMMATIHEAGEIRPELRRGRRPDRRSSAAPSPAPSAPPTWWASTPWAT